MSVTAPATGTVFATADIGGVQFPQNLITDANGADAVGLVAASPAPQTILGRLKAAVDAIINLAPATGHFAITASDSVNFTTPARAIYVGGAGNVVIVSGGVAVTYVGVPAGTVLPVSATRVNVTNTTATNLIGMI